MGTESAQALKASMIRAKGLWVEAGTTERRSPQEATPYTLHTQKVLSSGQADTFGIDIGFNDHGRKGKQKVKAQHGPPLGMVEKAANVRLWGGEGGWPEHETPLHKLAVAVGAEWQCSNATAGAVYATGTQHPSDRDRVGLRRLSLMSTGTRSSGHECMETGVYRCGETKFTLFADKAFVWDHGWAVIPAPDDTPPSTILQPLPIALAYLVTRLRADCNQPELRRGGGAKGGGYRDGGHGGVPLWASTQFKFACQTW